MTDCARTGHPEPTRTLSHLSVGNLSKRRCLTKGAVTAIVPRVVEYAKEAMHLLLLFNSTQGLQKLQP